MRITDVSRIISAEEFALWYAEKSEEVRLHIRISLAAIMATGKKLPLAANMVYYAAIVERPEGDSTFDADLLEYAASLGSDSIN